MRVSLWEIWRIRSSVVGVVMNEDGAVEPGTGPVLFGPAADCVAARSFAAVPDVVPGSAAAADRARYSSGAGDADVRPSAARGGAEIIVAGPDPDRPGPPLGPAPAEEVEEAVGTRMARAVEEDRPGGAGDALRRAAEAAVGRACAGVPPPPAIPPRRFSAFEGEVVGVPLVAGFRGINRLWRKVPLKIEIDVAGIRNSVCIESDFR